MSIRKFAPRDLEITPATFADRRYMDLNCRIGLWSKHLAHKIGACIVDDSGHVLSLGFNGHREGVEDGDPRHWTKPDRYVHSVHAEDNALLNAAINRVSVRGATMHVLRFPCAGDHEICGLEEGCSQKIVAAGIATLVVYSHPEDAIHPRHTESFRRSLALLVEHGVAIRWHDPDDEAYMPRMARQPDTLPVPSGTVRWPARFLDLACHVSGWHSDGTGEVIAWCPHPGDALTLSDPKLSDRMGKIVRSMGCWSEHGGMGALEALRDVGLSGERCAIFMSRPCGLARLRDIADTGIGTIFIPADATVPDEFRKDVVSRGMVLTEIEPDLQPASDGHPAPSYDV